MTNHKIASFWRIKHEIDDEVKRLGWSVDLCKTHIQQQYQKRSRLVMSDEQLIHLRDYLRSLPSPEKPVVTKHRDTKRRKRKRER